MADTALLNDVALFTELSTDELALLAAAAERHELQRNDLLFSEGDEPDRLYVVVTGRIAIANRSIDGRESMISLMERGDLFGEMPLFDGLGRSAEARALEASEVLSIPYGPLQEIYESGRPCCGAS